MTTDEIIQLVFAALCLGLIVSTTIAGITEAIHNAHNGKGTKPFNWVIPGFLTVIFWLLISL